MALIPNCNASTSLLSASHHCRRTSLSWLRMEQLALLLGLKKRPANADNPSAAPQYEPLELPGDFLNSPPPNPITCERIDWSQTALPEYGLRYAVVLDGVLTAEECNQLLDLAQQVEAGYTNGPWQPAMVSLGPGQAVRKNDLRNCDRFIWDHQQLANRLWDRIALAPSITETLATADWAVSQDFPQCY